ncbi:unnamed protein product, partial [Tilletia caries]
QTQGAREDANAPAENNNGQTAASGTADRPSASAARGASAARSASAAPGASAAPAASTAPAASVGGAPTTPVAGPARPKLKAATPALEKAKKEAAQSKGKWYLIQTMSRLKLDSKMKEVEIRNLAFDRISTRAQHL